MSAFDVLDRYGTAALLRFLAAVAVFVALHLLRLPLLLAARLLEVGMRRIDGYLLHNHTNPPDRPAAAHTTAEHHVPFRMPAGASA